MAASPKFRIIVQGIAGDMCAERVRDELAQRFTLTSKQIEQLLSNEAGPLVGLKAHEDAWVLRNELLDMGVECRIAPVPRSNLEAGPQKIVLLAPTHERRSQVSPRTRNVSRRIPLRRSRAGIRPSQRSPNKGFSVPPLLKVVAVLVAALVVTITFHAADDNSHDVLAVADSTR